MSVNYPFAVQSCISLESLKPISKRRHGCRESPSYFRDSLGFSKSTKASEVLWFDQFLLYENGNFLFNRKWWNVSRSYFNYWNAACGNTTDVTCMKSAWTRLKLFNSYWPLCRRLNWQCPYCHGVQNLCISAARCECIKNILILNSKSLYWRKNNMVPIFYLQPKRVCRPCSHWYWEKEKVMQEMEGPLMRHVPTIDQGTLLFHTQIQISWLTCYWTVYKILRFSRVAPDQGWKWLCENWTSWATQSE